MNETAAIRRASARIRRTPRAFTLVELLVVIGIIGLLVGLLLPALGKVLARSRATATQGTMEEFAKACDAYFQEFNEYPAAVPEEVLYAGLDGDSALPRITAAENALLALMGGIFVLEAGSVILQVASFKTTGRRIFKMSPLHHHFELSGWKESTVIVRFWILSIIFAFLGLATLKLR